MAQQVPTSSIATTSGVTTSALSIYMHHTWEALLFMSCVSLVLMSYGHIKLLFGKHELAKQQALINGLPTEKTEVTQLSQGYELVRQFKPSILLINTKRYGQQLSKSENFTRLRHLLTNS
jgi:hypothetical protein